MSHEFPGPPWDPYTFLPYDWNLTDLAKSVDGALNAAVYLAANHYENYSTWPNETLYRVLGERLALAREAIGSDTRVALYMAKYIGSMIGQGDAGKLGDFWMYDSPDYGSVYTSAVAAAIRASWYNDENSWEYFVKKLYYDLSYYSADNMFNRYLIQYAGVWLYRMHGVRPDQYGDPIDITIPAPSREG